MNDNVRIVFATTTTTELRFQNATFVTDADLTIVLVDGVRRFAIPTANVIAVEQTKAQPEPEPQAEPTPGEAQ